MKSSFFPTMFKVGIVILVRSISSIIFSIEGRYDLLLLSSFKFLWRNSMSIKVLLFSLVKFDDDNCVLFLL